jgi:hypothetical protein
MPFPLLIAAAICLALGLASLATPSGPTYDPYAWLIWGRDLAHLDLVTRGTGTSWKPLPTLIDAVLTTVGKHADDAWLAVARAGALYALFMAFRLAWRLASRGGRVAAGAIAAASLALTQQWLPQTGVGYAEGLTVAFGLLAVDRHLDGHRVQAFLLIVAAGLTRVEAWPFAAAYGGWLWATSGSKRDRAAIALGLLTILLLWFGGDWLGSGDPFTAADRALARRIPGSPGASAHPAAAVLREAFTMVPLPVWVGLAAALVIPHGRRRVTFVLTGCAAAWTAVVAAMAQRGYPGLPRFLFMAVGLEAVLAGIGAGCVAVALARAVPRLRPRASAVDMRHVVVPRAVGAVAGFAICAAFAFGSVRAARTVSADVAAIDGVADMDARLANAVTDAGGAAAVIRCGRPETPWWTVTALAWDLGVSPTDLRVVPKSELLPAPHRRAGANSRRRGRSSTHTSLRRRPVLLRRAPSCRYRRVESRGPRPARARRSAE